MTCTVPAPPPADTRSMGAGPAWAIRRRNAVEILYLIMTGLVAAVLIVIATRTEKETVLHIAAQHGREDDAEHLLGQGARVNARDRNGGTPLHSAVYWGHAGMAELLLEHGAKVNAKDKQGATPLHLAAYWGHEKIAGLLIECGARVNAKDRKGGTPLHLATQAGQGRITRKLIAHGADVKARDRIGVTPLRIAEFREDETTANLFKEEGAGSDRAAAIQTAGGDIAPACTKPSQVRGRDIPPIPPSPAPPPEVICH